MKSWCHVVLAGLAAVAASTAFAEDISSGFDELYRLDRLPAFKRSVEIGCVSSYDRSGGNDDGFSGKYSFVRKEGDTLVLADLKGPGFIYRIWTPTPTDDLLEFTFDGETTPRVQVNFRELFLGQHPVFPAPLVGFGAGGYWSYVPIPYAKSCIVRLRAPKAQFYQINYARYSAETPIKTFDSTAQQTVAESPKKARDLWNRMGADVSEYSAPPGARIERTPWSGTIQPGASQTVFHAEQGGRIVGLRFAPASAMAGRARDLLLRISFDGQAPAVLCPIGDFFGDIWGQPAMRSLLVGTEGESNYCYLPMPYDRSATVELVSERAAPLEARAEILHAATPRAANEGRFYALWRRENPTTLGEPYTLLETQGRGHVVGVVLQSQGFESGKTLFFEGDDVTMIDGNIVVHGTGSEDFFNGGWYDVPDRWEKRICFPLSGCLTYAKHLGRTAAYRFFLADAYPFQKGILQTIEHGGERNSIPTDYCSVTYFYMDGRPTSDLRVPPLEQRAVQDPREVIFPAWWQTPIYAWSFNQASLTRKIEKLGGKDVRFLSLSAEGEDWFGPHFLSPTCDVPAAGTYAIFLEAIKGPAQAKVQLFQNENPVSEPVDFYAAAREESGRVFLGRLPLTEGRNNLMLKLVGRNEQASGLALDLINVICARD